MFLGDRSKLGLDEKQQWDLTVIFCAILIFLSFSDGSSQHSSSACLKVIELQIFEVYEILRSNKSKFPTI